MPINLPWATQKKSFEEAQQENEQLEVEYSIEQKKAAIRKLKQAGVDPKSLGTWSRVFQWLKSH
jgi:hypothetical protein